MACSLSTKILASKPTPHGLLILRNPRPGMHNQGDKMILITVLNVLAVLSRLLSHPCCRSLSVCTFTGLVDHTREYKELGIRLIQGSNARSFGSHPASHLVSSPFVDVIQFQSALNANHSWPTLSRFHSHKPIRTYKSNILRHGSELYAFYIVRLAICRDALLHIFKSQAMGQASHRLSR
jgi:hypothetical protein